MIRWLESAFVMVWKNVYLQWLRCALACHFSNFLLLICLRFLWCNSELQWCLYFQVSLFTQVLKWQRDQQFQVLKPNYKISVLTHTAHICSVFLQYLQQSTCNTVDYLLCIHLPRLHESSTCICTQTTHTQTHRVQWVHSSDMNLPPWAGGVGLLMSP